MNEVIYMCIGPMSLMYEKFHSISGLFIFYSLDLLSIHFTNVPTFTTTTLYENGNGNKW